MDLRGNGDQHAHPRVLCSEQAMMEIYHLEGGRQQPSELMWAWGQGGWPAHSYFLGLYWLWVDQWVCRWAQGSRVDGEGPPFLALAMSLGFGFVSLASGWVHHGAGL